MADQKRAPLWEQARELFRATDGAQPAVEPDFLEKYAGEWAVVDGGRVIAHGKDGAEVAKAVSVADYPYSILYYVPTLEEQAGVRILTQILAQKPAR